MIDKKASWLATKIIFWLIVICHLVYMSLHYIMHFELDAFFELELRALVNSVIGVPYHQRLEYKNNSSNLKYVSKQDWQNNVM